MDVNIWHNAEKFLAQASSDVWSFGLILEILDHFIIPSYRIVNCCSRDMMAVV